MRNSNIVAVNRNFVKHLYSIDGGHIATTMANVTLGNRTREDLLLLLQVREEISLYKPPPTVIDSNDAELFFAYFTPFILAIGIFGNILSFCVFVSKNMRKLAASVYLAALSFSDLMTLLIYVTGEWIKRGLPIFLQERTDFIFHVNIICQAHLYFSYVFRFLSAWLVVVFTVERYIGVCHPLRLKDFTSSKGSRRNILTVLGFASVVLIYKPVLSTVHHLEIPKTNITVDLCTGSQEHKLASFVLDVIYSLTITLIPFSAIITLNILIIRKILMRRRSQIMTKSVTHENVIRFEFTIILLVISFCFVAFNLPYFCVWCIQFLEKRNISENNSSSIHHSAMEEIFIVTKTIFFMNYCINFFLYSITGAYFRQELKMMFSRKQVKKRSAEFCSYKSVSTTPGVYNSWV